MEHQINPLHGRGSNSTESTRSRRSNRSSVPDEPPRFTIDLSLPPEQRYVDMCTALEDEMIDLTALFDEVVGEMISFLPINALRILAKTFLRRVHDSEENAELKGISKAIGVDMYLLVAFNVLLDLFMGCSSGGAVVRTGASLESGSKMLHFRTLDWWMDKLRRIVVQLDYVLEEDGPVIASSVSYAGFVGVLTGVRKDFSVSLNFRSTRVDVGKFWASLKYRWHLLMVLLGKRPSISSQLRQSLLPSRKKGKKTSSPSFLNEAEGIFMSYSNAVKKFGGEVGKNGPVTTTCCYLCFSKGTETTVIEKDRTSAKVRSSSNFIVVTNCDEESDGSKELKKNSGGHAAMQEIIEEAKDREECARDNWSDMRNAKLETTVLPGHGDLKSLMEVGDVIELVQKYPTVNECTHFACVLDPTEGRIKWCRRWMRPVDDRWIRQHS